MIHSPQLSEKNFGIISNSLEGFEDNSWINDACDSIYSEDLGIEVFFPNTETPNVNKIDTFLVILKDSILETYHNFKTVEEVVEFIKSQKK